MAKKKIKVCVTGIMDCTWSKNAYTALIVISYLKKILKTSFCLAILSRSISNSCNYSMWH